MRFSVIGFRHPQPESGDRPRETQGLGAADPQRLAPIQQRGRAPESQYVNGVGFRSGPTEQQRFGFGIQRRRQYRLTGRAAFGIEQPQRRHPGRLRLHLPALRLQRRAHRRQRAGDLYVQRPAPAGVALVAARRQAAPVRTPPVVGRERASGRRRRELRQHPVDRPRRVPQRRDREADEEHGRHRAHPERAADVAAIGDAQHQQPHDAEQRAADDVAEPVRAEIQTGEADQGHRGAGDQIRPHPLPAWQLTRDQHREEAEHNRHHRHRDRRKPETTGGCRRSRHVHRQAEERREYEAEGHRRQPVQRRGEAPPPQQPRHRQQQRGQQHRGVAERGERGHQPVRQRVAQGRHRGLDLFVQRQRTTLGHHHGEQREPAPADPQQAHRQHRQRCGFRPVVLDQRRGVATQPRMCAGPLQRARQQAVGVAGEPAIGVQHHRPHQRQHGDQGQQHQRQAVRHRRHCIVGRAEHPARGQEARRPQHRRDQARRHVAAQRHAQHARHRGHERPHRADEPGDHDALAAVLAEHAFAAVDQLWIAAEQPVLAHRRPPAVAQPVTERIAGECAKRGAGQGIRAIQMAQTDQRAHREQQRQRRHHDPHHRQRIAERDQENHAARGHRVRGDPCRDAVQPFARHPPIMAGGVSGA